MEVMLVLVIIAAIAALAINNLGAVSKKADERAAKIKIQALKGQVDFYKLEMKSLPPDLEALYTKPGNAPNVGNWIQFSKEPIAPDPWGRPYEYTVNGEEYEIRSLGYDGQRSDDDIVG
jgi:general secretion pathway protein G